jgi:hypothetical protein
MISLERRDSLFNLEPGATEKVSTWAGAKLGDMEILMRGLSWRTTGVKFVVGAVQPGKKKKTATGTRKRLLMGINTSPQKYFNFGASGRMVKFYYLNLLRVVNWCLMSLSHACFLRLPARGSQHVSDGIERNVL